MDAATEEGKAAIAECKKEEEAFYKQAYDGMLKAVSTEMFPICGMDQGTVDYLLATMSIHYKKYDVGRYLSIQYGRKTDEGQSTESERRSSCRIKKGERLNRQ